MKVTDGEREEVKKARVRKRQGKKDWGRKMGRGGVERGRKSF